MIYIKDMKHYEGLIREQLIVICKGFDSNGIYTDEDSMNEGLEPITKEELLEILQGWKNEE